MTTRREMLRAIGVSATPGAAASLGCGVAAWSLTATGCAGAGDAASYESVASRVWHLGPTGDLSGHALATELVRCATLAPSSHNTQCWKFALEKDGITILPDLTRRCPAVDPDDHHLFVSLGCAAENLVQAALAHGRHADVEFDPGRDAVRVTFQPTKAVSTAMYKAIPDRQSTRGAYDGQALSKQDLAMLEAAASSARVRLILLTDASALEQMIEYVVAGNTAQMADEAFVAELKAWIRFSGADAVRSGDGLYTASSGNPVPPAAWIGRLMFGLFFTPKAENDKYARNLRSSAGVAVFVGQTADKAHWVEVGRSYERFALQSAAIGVRNAFINQPVEVAALRPQFASHLGLNGQRPDLVVRFGRGARLPPSLRRPVQAVLA